MSLIDDNKQIALAFCDNYTKGAWDGLGDLLAKEFRWRPIASRRRQSPILAEVPLMNSEPGYDKKETLEIFRSTQQMCVDGRFDLIPNAFTCEGERVAFEAAGYAVSKANGRIYDNKYHHLMRVRQGKIVELREYQDTLLVFDVWMAP
jgi:ketosteroid isomerase-like protein